MNKPLLAGIAFVLGILGLHAQYSVFNPHPDETLTADGKWKLHDPERPWPISATPLAESELAASAKAPKNAVILFDGQNLDAWNVPKVWQTNKGILTVQPSALNLGTKESFGSCHLHLEWKAPAQSQNSGQDRANSGIFLMSTYEVQVLDTYENKTYADGMGAALYGVKPPDVNALRPSGEWQYYDIWFKRPTFDAQGKMATPACVTVLVNGIVVHKNVPFDGPSFHKRRPPYGPHADALPLRLQYHSQVVSFRNIWLEPFPDDRVTSPVGPVDVQP